MVGDIFAPRVIIVDGARFRGSVDMGDIENMPVRKPQAERPRPTSTSASTTSTRPTSTISSTPRPSSTPTPPPARTPTPPPRPAAPPPVLAAPPAPPADEHEEEIEEEVEETAGLPTDPPAAKGLPQKSQKARVIVKRR